MRLPSFSTGFAKNRGQSAHPDLWDGLVLLLSPEMGKQGDKLYDWSGRAHHATLNSMDASTDYIGGKYGYALNYDGSNDNVTTPNIPEINAVSQTMTVMGWFRTTNSSNNCLFSYDNNDSLSPTNDFYCYTPANVAIGGFCDGNERSTGVAVNDGKWHHIAVVARKTSVEFWMDGVLRFSATGLTQKGTDYTTGHTFRLADNSNISHMAGDIGEVRVYNRDLTGSQIRRSYLAQSPLEESPIYVGMFNGDNSFSPAPLDALASVLAPTVSIDSLFSPSPLDATATLLTPADVGSVVTVNPSPLDALASVLSPDINIDSVFSPSPLDAVSSVLSPTFPGLAKFGSKIINFNPLVILGDSTPATITRVDISDPDNPVWTIHILSGVSGAKDVVYSSIFDTLYVACNNGKIVEVDANDFDNQNIIDTEDVQDLENISLLPGMNQIYAGTEDTLGEIITIDYSTIGALSLDVRMSQRINSILDLDIRTVLAGVVDTDIRMVANIANAVNCDIRFQPAPFDEIAQDPISRPDWHVFINGVDMDDVKLDAISIYHGIDEKSRASFILARRHDKLDYKLDGTASEITNNNDVRVEINGIVEFEGKVDNISCQSETETVEVTALSTEIRGYDFKHITLSIPTVNEKLHLYHCLVHDPVIYKPYIDPLDENPPLYKGISVNLGTKVTQNVSRFSFIGDITSTLNAVVEGNFQPKQNWTYFWFAKARNFVTGTEWATMRYIGTSPNSLTTDTWEVTGLSYMYQREFDNIEEELGSYTVGEAPFKEISSRNGKFIAKDKWIDEPDGLYRVRDEAYDYTNFSKKVADLEYQKLLNINGDILPKTSATIEMFLDGYYYFNVQLLNRIHIDGTTQPNIYYNQNGFPVAVKGIELSSQSMRVSLRCDNELSQVELEAIDAQFPDEEDALYLYPEQMDRQYSKFDPNKFSTIE